MISITISLAPFNLSAEMRYTITHGFRSNTFHYSGDLWYDMFGFSGERTLIETSKLLEGCYGSC